MTYRPENQKYIDAIYDRLYIRVRKGKKDIYKQLADSRGESLAGMITKVLDQMAVEAGLMSETDMEKEED